MSSCPMQHETAGGLEEHYGQEACSSHSGGQGSNGGPSCTLDNQLRQQASSRGGHAPTQLMWHIPASHSPSSPRCGSRGIVPES